MTQRNSCTTWVGSERLNSEPNSTLIGRHRNFRYLNSGSHLVPSTRLLNRCHTRGGGLTQSLHFRDEASARRNTVMYVERGSGDVS